MRRKSLEVSLSMMLALHLGTAPRLAMAASPAIGTIVTRGAFRLNHATVMNNATLFEGATVETGTAASRMDLVSGTRLELGSDSQGRFFGDHLVLERGQSVLHKAQGFRVEARGLTILPDSGASAGRILLPGSTRVQVSAVMGSFRVLNSRGVVVARIPSGKALVMESQVSGGRTRLTGRLVVRGGHYLLTDETTNVTVELAAKKSLANETGRRVEVTGLDNPTDTPSSDATQVIEVAQVTPAPTGSGGSSGGSAGGAAAGGTTGGAASGAAVSVTLIAVVAGVAAAAVVGGLAATGGLGGSAAAPVSR